MVKAAEERMEMLSPYLILDTVDHLPSLNLRSAGRGDLRLSVEEGVKSTIDYIYVSKKLALKYDLVSKFLICPFIHLCVLLAGD